MDPETWKTGITLPKKRSGGEETSPRDEAPQENPCFKADWEKGRTDYHAGIKFFSRGEKLSWK